jgi:hypothetical protein
MRGEQVDKLIYTLNCIEWTMKLPYSIPNFKKQDPVIKKIKATIYI